MRTIRIFVSSPGDVTEERDRARQVVEGLRRRYVGELDLRTVLWEELPLQADASFQQGIDLVLAHEHGIDIAVFILWARLGSPLGPLIRREDGREYRSGTERELDLMLRSRARSGGVHPQVLVYTRRDDVSFDERLRGRPAEEQKRLADQKDLAERFIVGEFHDAERRTNLRAYHVFDRPTTFSRRLRVHLQELLDELAGGTRSEPVWDIARQGAPFRGLEVFELAHAAVFFGREDEVLEVRQALGEQARRGCAFVLIAGASGSGKSSLARAGVLPAVVEHEVDDRVRAWRRAACTPGQLGDDLLAGLARVLASDDALPELRGGPEALDEFAEGLRRDPELTFGLRIKEAFARAGGVAPGAVRLILLVDQLEELFTGRAIGTEMRAQFVRCLEVLARSGSVWVLATMRSDFYEAAQSLEALVRMKAGRGQVELLPPGADALRRLIEQPARLAGLAYERRGEQSLADAILEDAAEHPELLPLLEYVLLALFEQRTEQNELTFATYDALGGLQGALANRAESTFTQLSAVAQRSFAGVMSHLVSVSGDAEERVVRRWAPLGDIDADPSARELTDALRRERLLTTDRGRLAVAHEALLRAWPRAVAWVTGNREFLRVRARVAQRMHEGSRLLEGDPLLAAAVNMLATRFADFSEAEREFISGSMRAVERAQRRRRRGQVGGVIALSMLTLMALGASFQASKQRGRADDQAQRGFANAAMLEPDAARRLAFFAKAASIVPDNPLRGRALHELLYRGWALPLTQPLRREGSVSAEFSPDGTRVVTASQDGTAQVWDAATGTALTAPLRHEGVQSASFSPDGTWVLSASGDGTVRVWEARTGAALTEPMRHEHFAAEPAIRHAAVFSPDGTRLVTASSDGTARVWAVERAEVLAELRHEAAVFSAAFSPDGTRIVTASDDGTARIWRVDSWLMENELHHERGVSSAAFSPDGTRVVTASRDRTARVWDAGTGTPLTDPLLHQDSVRSAEFSADGTLIATASWDKVGRLWNAGSGALMNELHDKGGVVSATFSTKSMRVVTTSRDGTTRAWEAGTGKALTEPLSNVSSAMLSPDGMRLVTVSMNGMVQLWEVRTQAELTRTPQHRGVVLSAAFSPDGKRVVTASWDRTAWVCEAGSGAVLSEAIRHGRAVNSAAFSPDGTRVATASEDKTARVWDPKTGAALTEPMRHEDTVFSAAFSPDGTRLVTASFDGTARVWDSRTAVVVTELRHDGTVLSATFSPDGARVVTGSGDGTARVWDAVTGAALTTLPHDQAVNSAAFSADGTRVITASEDGTARVWDTGTGTAVTEPLRHKGAVRYAVFSPDGTRVVTASEDKTALVWEARTGAALTEPLRHDDAVLFVAFSPDGTRIATASRDGAVQLWEAGTGVPLTDRLNYEGLTRSAAFSPDGARLVTGDGIWDVPLADRGDVQDIARLAEAVGGYKVNEAGVVVALPNDVRVAVLGEFRERPKRIHEGTDRSSNSATFNRIRAWFFGDPTTRPPSPLSENVGSSQ